MNLKKIAVCFGLVFLLMGVLGFVPGITENEMLFGIFHVNPAHNMVHLLSGAVALICAMAGSGAARLFFQFFGLVYGAIAVLGLVKGDVHLFGMISNNMADVWLHGIISLVSLVLGFGMREERVVRKTA
jgi:hypothetical protein